VADDKPDPCVVCHRTATPLDSLCTNCRTEFANEDGKIDLSTWSLIERVAKRAWAFALEHLDAVPAKSRTSSTTASLIAAGYRPGDPGASRSTGRRRRR